MRAPIYGKVSATWPARASSCLFVRRPFFFNPCRGRLRSQLINLIPFNQLSQSVSKKVYFISLNYLILKTSNLEDQNPYLQVLLLCLGNYVHSESIQISQQSKIGKPFPFKFTSIYFPPHENFLCNTRIINVLQIVIVLKFALVAILSLRFVLKLSQL